MSPRKYRAICLTYSDKMNSTVLTKKYILPSFDTREILRYAGVSGSSPDFSELMQSCLDETDGKLLYRVCYREFGIKTDANIIDLGFAKTESDDLAKNLQGCESIVLFAATVGIELDRLIAKYSRISPSKALFFQAIGAERIECLCDTFNREIVELVSAAGKVTKPRFSPGYGDLPLSLQKDIFRALDCPRKIGLTLNGSLLMSPSKSVTAIIGIGDKNTYCGKELT